MDLNSKPLYQPWSEEAFLSDYKVVSMTPIQRWMYRTLLQSAFVCSTRPYLPNDPEELWQLAGCESLEQWTNNAKRVLSMFVEVDKDGVSLLSRPRLTKDWNRLEEKRKQIEDRSKKATAARWGDTGEKVLEESTSIDEGFLVDAKEVSEVKEVKKEQEQTPERAIYKKPVSLDMFVQTVKRLRGICDDPRFLKDTYKSLRERFDTHVMYDHLEPWWNKNKASQYPLKEFFRAVPSIILAAQETDSVHPDLEMLCAFIFETSGYAPSGKFKTHLNELLQNTPRVELEKCFKECMENNKDQDPKWMVREFCQGAAEAIILARKIRYDRLGKQQEMIDARIDQYKSQAEQESADFAAKESEEAKLAEESLEFFLTDGDAAEETVAGATPVPSDG